MNKKLHKTIINRNTGLIVVVAENKMAVFSFSGSLKNNFDKDKVQSEIDLQVKVTQEFRSNVQHFQAEQNKRKDELKAKLERNEISQADYDEQVSRIQKQSLLVNMVAGGLLSPADSLTGVAVSAVSPAVSYAVGQHFKKEGKEGSFEHIATHAVIGALTSAANGGNALSGAVSAGGAEYIAKVTAETLFQKDAKDLTADEKQTVSSIAQLVGVVLGSVTGDSSANAYIGNLNAQTAVNNNLLSPDEWKELSRLDELARKNGTLTKAQAERAKFLLNKHGYSEKLLAKEQNGETLSKNEQVYLDNAVWEQADGNPDIAKNIRKYKGSVQSDYRELNKIADREIGYNSSVQGQLSQTMQPVVAAGALYGTAYYLGGYTPTTFGGSVLQTFGQNVLTSNTIAKATGSNYDTATLVSDGVLVLPAMGLTKARTAMVSGSKLGLVQNPQTMKWVETSQQGMPLYWRTGLYFEQKGLEIVGGDTTAKTLRQTTFKDNNKDIIQYNKKNNP